LGLVIRAGLTVRRTHLGETEASGLRKPKLLWLDGQQPETWRRPVVTTWRGRHAALSQSGTLAASSDLSFPTPRATDFLRPAAFSASSRHGMQPASTYCGPRECSPDQPIDRTPPFAEAFFTRIHVQPNRTSESRSEVVWITASTNVVRRHSPLAEWRFKYFKPSCRRRSGPPYGREHFPHDQNDSLCHTTMPAWLCPR